MTEYSHEALRDLAGAYAIGATSSEETRAMEEAVAASPSLAAEVMAYQNVVTDLVMAQRGVVPSANVRERLLERIHSPSVAAVTRSPRRSWIPLAAAASLLFVLGAGAQLLRQQRELGTLRATEQQVATQLEHRETTLNTLLHAEKNLRVVHLKAADTVVGPGIQLFWDAHQQKAIVHAFRLPPAPAGHAYQLWAVVNNEPVSVRVFDSAPDGHALVEGIAMPEFTQSLSKMLVTVEPRGGSRAPTSVPLLGGPTTANE